MVIRCTTRLLSVLGVKPSELQSRESAEDDWYANMVWIDRRKCVLLSHAATLFSIFVADVLKHDLMPFGQWAVERISAELEVEGLPPFSLGRLDARGAALARTSSRTVLGYMNEMTRYCEYAIAASGGLELVDLKVLNRELRRQLHFTRESPGWFVPLERAMARARLR